MIDVMIIDDEYLIRELIKKLVDWDELGLRVVSEIESGKNAMAEIEKVKPDIILMDINIPFINGIELSKLIYERYPEIKIIILTGHGEFEYAKEAIKAKVVEYLLKPINKELLKIVLKDTTKTVIEDRKLSNIIKNASKLEDELNKEKFVYSLLNKKKSFTESELNEGFKKYFNKIDKKGLLAFAVSIDDLEIRCSTLKEREETLQYVKELFVGYINTYKSYEFIIANDMCIYCIYSHEFDENIYINELKKLFENVKQELSKINNQSINMVVSKNVEYVENLPQVMKNLKKQLAKKFVNGRSNFGIAQDYYPVGDFEFEIFYNKEEILSALRLANIKELRELINEIFDELRLIKCSKEYAVFIINHLFSVFIEYFHDTKNENSEFMTKNHELLEELNSKEFLVDMENSLNNIVSEYLVVKSKQKNSTQKLLEKAKKIVDDEYHKKDISVEYIADKINTNVSYLGHVFKEEFGITLKSYISDCRLNNAKRIIDADKEVLLYKVADIIGYDDPYYFSKCFKKKFGITPTKYMENRE